MKTVTLTRDLRPWREGDNVHLDDSVADALLASGEAKDLRTFGEMPLPPVATAKTYQTRDLRPQRRGKGYRHK